MQRRINEGYQIASVGVFTDKNGKSYGSIAYNPVKDGMDVRVQNIAVDVASGGDPSQKSKGWGTADFGYLFSFGPNNVVGWSESADHTLATSNSDWGLVRSSSYAGVYQSKRDEAGLINHNAVYTDGELSGQSLTLLKTVSLAYDAGNLSVTGGLNIGDFEIHTGFTATGGITLGSSWSDETGITGSDATVSVGTLIWAPLKRFFPGF